MRILLPLAASLIFCWPAVAQSSASGPVPTTSNVPRVSAQAEFDALVEFVGAKNWAEVVRAAPLLLTRVSAMKKPSASVLASVNLIYATGLSRVGRESEALSVITDVINQGSLAVPAMLNDHYDALMLAGTLHERALDLDLAALRYVVANEIAPTTNTKVRALGAMSRSLVTIDPARAINSVDTALSLIPDDKVSKEVRAAFNNLKGRALLNAGRHAEAFAILNTVITKLGGLTTRVSQSDIAARADAALAAFLANKPDDARRLIAFTGAANLGKDEFAIGNDMRPPQCGGLSGIKPDDVAVIEFSVSDDGNVTDATPIYTNRPGPMGIEFAKTVNGWWWAPDVAKAIKPFFRVAVRLQMRCTLATDRPQTEALLAGDYAAWRAKLNIQDVPVFGGNRLEAGAALKATLAQRERERGATSVTLLPVIDQLIDGRAAGAAVMRQLSERAIKIAASAGATDRAVNHILLRHAFLPNLNRSSAQIGKRMLLSELVALKSQPSFVRDARSLALLNLAAAATVQSLRNYDEALVLFRAVGEAVQTLPAGDPVRVAALIQLASAEQAAANSEAATAAFAKSGLSAQQCALADAKPPQIGGTGGAFDYPPEALNWGFNGWVVTEFDISAAGKSTNIRPLIAYPPYVFAGAANKIVGRFRYRETFRPDGGLGCGSNSQRITFRNSSS